jgi:probable phosphoglycerate mutase
MARPILYFIRHGETDWNAERRLQGQRDILLNSRGRVQAASSGTILRELLARDDRAVGDLDYVSSPLGRARETMELMRAALGLESGPYRIDDRLKEMSFGRWEGFTYEELQGRESAALKARERDKWSFVIPEGESYAQLVVRVRAWYEEIACDTVVVAHGGVCRALIAHLGIEPAERATFGEIGQGVVYVFVGNSMSRYG